MKVLAGADWTNLANLMLSRQSLMKFRTDWGMKE